MFTLDVQVLGAGGTVTPLGFSLHVPGSVVYLNAQKTNPADVVIWAGTDDDGLTIPDNTVTMNSNRSVTVRFHTPETLWVGTDYDYQTIQQALDVVGDHDIVMVNPGTYDVTEASEMLNVLLIDGRPITLTSATPEQPELTQIIGAIVLANVGPGHLV